MNSLLNPRQRNWRLRRDTRDTSVKSDHEAKVRCDLGLQLLSIARKPGSTFTRYDIACWAGVTDAAIYRLEVKALVKLRNLIQFGRGRRIFLENDL